jgi:hypothetical protein
LVAGVVALGVWFVLVGPRPPAWLPQCPFHAITGLYCPGCGSTRALHALAHGELAAACRFNPLVVLALPLLAAWAVARVWKTLRGDATPVRQPPRAATVALVVLVSFFLLRNLPWWPFALLAPHG